MVFCWTVAAPLMLVRTIPESPTLVTVLLGSVTWETESIRMPLVRKFWTVHPEIWTVVALVATMPSLSSPPPSRTEPGWQERVSDLVIERLSL
jgi:hypothetical protein